MTFFEQVDRLAQRVLAGQVAFFVGAGFSQDSEQNSAGRLQSRLLARFDALTVALEHAELRRALVVTFRLEALVTEAGGRLLSASIVKKLSSDYYLLNDWMCAAFAILLEKLRTMATAEAELRLKEVYALENAALVAYREVVPTSPIVLNDLAQIQGEAARGKVLFLETLGFDSEDIMAGAPFDADVMNVRLSYRLRPRRRHEVLARLAREGLCPTLVTTNYDLLIEGAYRLAGFEPRRTPTAELVAPTFMPHFAVVAEPLEFVDLGSGSRTALVLKLHGCARLYREAKAKVLNRLKTDSPRPEGFNEWERYLRAIVYTYREIQNWREDSWSRDFLCTLLRTRTLVLCGYSAADSVVHDTFRTVYEELARYRAARVRLPAPAASDAREQPARDAPAFFLGPEGSWEFHGAEILRAATRAAGCESPELTGHPNYVQFEFAAEAAFPTLDDVFVWLFHRVMRVRQAQALQQDVRRVATQLLSRPPTDGELAAIRQKFSELIEAEQAAANELGRGSPRRGFSSMVDWTDQFHVAFLRQLALADSLARRQSSRPKIDELRRVPTWYFPISERPDWGAWAVVVELALRQMIAAHLGPAVDWKALPDSVVVHANAGVPSLTWHSDRGASTLAIRWQGDPLSSRLTFAGAPRSRRLWQPPAEQLPWILERPVTEACQPKDATPDARQIWEFAVNGRGGDVRSLLEQAEEREPDQRERQAS